jgi:hypothetical protein
MILFVGFQGDERGNLGSKTDTVEEAAASKLTGKQWVKIRKTPMCTQSLIYSNHNKPHLH